jgi:hypothetical protein
MYESGKMRPVETVPRMGEGRIMKNNGEGEFNYDIYLRTYCHNVPPV